MSSNPLVDRASTKQQRVILRPSTKIPIPSFRYPTIANTASSTKCCITQSNNHHSTHPAEDRMAHDSPNNNTTNNNNGPMIRLAAVTEQAMTQLESVLQLFLKSKSKPSLSYTEFCKCVSKIAANATTMTKITNSDTAAAVPSSTTTIANTMLEDNNDDDNNNKDHYYLLLYQLSREERYWHDLYCIAVPTLYTAMPDTGELSLTKTTTSSFSFPINRFKEWRRLTKDATENGIPMSSSQRAIQILLSLRSSFASQKRKHAIPIHNNSNTSTNSVNSTHTNQAVAPGTSMDPSQYLLALNSDIAQSLLSSSHHNITAAWTMKTNTTSSSSSLDAATTLKPSLESILHSNTTTTIEERIHARAQERKRNWEQVDAAKKDPREDRVAIADQLYTHACQILRGQRRRRLRLSGSSSLSSAAATAAAATTTKMMTTTTRLYDHQRKQKRYHSNNKQSSSHTTTVTRHTSPTTTCVVLTFVDAVEKVIRNRPRRDVARLFQDIVRVLSSSSSSSSDDDDDSTTHDYLSFLRWTDPQTGRNNGIPIPKQATVWIETANYKRARAILNNERATVSKSEPSLQEAAAPTDLPVRQTVISTSLLSTSTTTTTTTPKHTPQLSPITSMVTVSSKKKSTTTTKKPITTVGTIHAQPVTSMMVGTTEGVVEKRALSSSSPAVGFLATPSSKSLSVARVFQNNPTATHPSSDKTLRLFSTTSSSPLLKAGNKRSIPESPYSSSSSNNNNTHPKKFRQSVLESDVMESTSSAEEEEEEEEDDNIPSSPYKYHPVAPTMLSSSTSLSFSCRRRRRRRRCRRHEHNPQMLRINPNHILWDVDKDGGIAIPPSLEFPRGLRRLFLALNNGERI